MTVFCGYCYKPLLIYGEVCQCQSCNEDKQKKQQQKEKKVEKSLVDSGKSS